MHSPPVVARLGLRQARRAPRNHWTASPGHAPSGEEMLESLRQHRASQLLGTAVSVFRANDWTLNRRDPDGLRYVASVWVWVNWCNWSTAPGTARNVTPRTRCCTWTLTPVQRFPALVRNPCLFRFRAIVKTVLRAMASSHRAPYGRLFFGVYRQVPAHLAAVLHLFELVAHWGDVGHPESPRCEFPHAAPYRDALGC